MAPSTAGQMREQGERAEGQGGRLSVRSPVGIRCHAATPHERGGSTWQSWMMPLDME